MRRIRKIEKIGTIIDKVLKNCNIENLVLEELIISNLENLLDKRIAKHIKASHIENRILFIKLDSPVWANELLFLKKEIIEKINTDIKKKYIKNIIFTS